MFLLFLSLLLTTCKGNKIVVIVFFFQNWFQLSSVDNCEFSLPFDVLTDICLLQQSDFFQAQCAVFCSAFGKTFIWRIDIIYQ